MKIRALRSRPHRPSPSDLVLNHHLHSSALNPGFSIGKCLQKCDEIPQYSMPFAHYRSIACSARDLKRLRKTRRPHRLEPREVRRVLMAETQAIAPSHRQKRRRRRRARVMPLVAQREAKETVRKRRAIAPRRFLLKTY